MSRSVLHIGTGYGGSLYGLTRAGFKVVKSIDRDPQCIELARLNFPDIDFMNISLQAFANTRIVDGEDRLSVADAYPVDLIWASYSLSGVRTFPSKTPYRSWVLALENIIQQYETPPKLVISMHGNPGALRAEDHFEQYYDQSPGCCLVTDPLSSSLAVNFSLTIYGYSGDKFVQIKAIKKSLGQGS
jgi:SAM-dependent methyltransferase